MSEHQTRSSPKISERLRTWYEGGRKGLETLCETEGAPETVVVAARRWYEKGDARLRCIIAEIEAMEDAKDR